MDDPKLKKYDDLKLEFWFHFMEYFDGLLNGQAQKFVSFGLRGTLNVRKRNKKIPSNRL